ncbi:MAG TPA: ubiquinol-cytochrome c reductase iron-sulfur subunit, partial [Rhodopila sp.]
VLSRLRLYLGAMWNSCIRRRVVLGVGTMAILGPTGAPAVQPDPAGSLPQAGDLLVHQTHPQAGAVIDPNELAAGTPPVLAWAMEPNSGIVRNHLHFGLIVLLRLSADDLTEAETRFAADGIVAFSAICTHAGCVVSGWRPAESRLFCPCHGSVYDPADGGRVVAGPAPRPLPTLKLRIDDGKLSVASGFSARIGSSTGRTD